MSARRPRPRPGPAAAARLRRLVGPQAAARLRRLARGAGGAALVLVGAVMLVTPGPGLLLIYLGLRLLGVLSA